MTDTMNEETMQEQIENLPDTSEARPKGIEIEDILAFQAKGLSHGQIATLLGCSRSNITKRLSVLDLQGLENYKNHKAEVWENLQRKLTKSVTDETINKMSGLQLITGSAIIQDKIMTMRGLASDIVEHRVVVASLDDVMDRMRQAGLVNVQDTEFVESGKGSGGVD